MSASGNSGKRASQVSGKDDAPEVLGTRFVPLSSVSQPAPPPRPRQLEPRPPTKSRSVCWLCAKPCPEQNLKRFGGWPQCTICCTPRCDLCFGERTADNKMICGGLNDDGTRADQDGCTRIHPALIHLLMPTTPMPVHYGLPSVGHARGMFGGGLSASPAALAAHPPNPREKRPHDNDDDGNDPEWKPRDTSSDNDVDDDEDDDDNPDVTVISDTGDDGNNDKENNESPAKRARTINFTPIERVPLIEAAINVLQSDKGADMDTKTIEDHLEEVFPEHAELANVDVPCPRSGKSLNAQFAKTKRSYTKMAPIWEARLAKHCTGITRGGPEDRAAAIQDYNKFRNPNMITWIPDYFDDGNVFGLMKQYMAAEKDDSHAYRVVNGRRTVTPKGRNKSKQHSKIENAKKELCKGLNKVTGGGGIAEAIVRCEMAQIEEAKKHRAMHELLIQASALQKLQGVVAALDPGESKEEAQAILLKSVRDLTTKMSQDSSDAAEPISEHQKLGEYANRLAEHEIESEGGSLPEEEHAIDVEDPD
eukprot:m.274271 g.274271  ORF g.274271 m.274271 type:complete len:535 (+) comp16133_c0_seq2:171-1775(+)